MKLGVGIVALVLAAPAAAVVAWAFWPYALAVLAVAGGLAAGGAVLGRR